MDAELVLDAKAALGEGPSWNAREGLLYWVDIMSCRVHCFDPETREDRTIDTASRVGAVAPCASGGLVAALAAGLAFIDIETGTVSHISDPESDLPGNRFNDGKCDPAGRFWAGSCSLGCDVPGAGSLYCMEPDLGVRKVMGNLTISNVLTWSPDHKPMYFIDTPTSEIWAFDSDISTGAISHKRVAARIPEAAGYPDGMTGGREGMLWVAD